MSHIEQEYPDAIQRTQAISAINAKVIPFPIHQPGVERFKKVGKPTKIDLALPEDVQRDHDAYTDASSRVRAITLDTKRATAVELGLQETMLDELGYKERAQQARDKAHDLLNSPELTVGGEYSNEMHLPSVAKIGGEVLRIIENS